MMAEDRHGQGLNDTQAERSTSPAVRIASYGVITALVIAIILLATGAEEFGPF
jgi:hypothetical protein